MQTNIVLGQSNQMDLCLLHFGQEDCSPGHVYGPSVREHYVVHYIIKGSGTFRVDGKNYQLKENQGFLISPQCTVYYQADLENPWVYDWVGFNGIKAGKYLSSIGLNQHQPIFETNTQDGMVLQLFEKMLSLQTPSYSGEMLV